jgi:peptide/nickel transport system ATP-binding protein
MSLLVARGLTVSATIAGKTVQALRELDFALAPGRMMGLVGESGAGKSMIGRTIAQVLPPGFRVSGGSLTFDGRDLVTMDARSRRDLLGKDIAFIPQEPLSALNPVFTIGQQIDEHLARLGVRDRGERRERALAMFDAVHLPHGADLLTKYPHQLSGGMCQRVLIAMAFASRPRLVVADEPTTALDVTIQARIVQLIREMQEKSGTAVVFITHDLKLAAQICDEILVLYAGRPVERGPARTVFASPTHPYTRCLQLANPNLSGPRRALHSLPEQMPGLLGQLALDGCRFAPRCPLVEDACRRAEPPTVVTGADHAAACLRAASTASIAAPAIGTVPAGTGSGGPLVTVDAVTKRYALGGGFLSSRRHFDAVKGVSLAIARNEFVGVVGESGSGKSTLAKLIVGLETPTAGSIVMGGRDVTDGSRLARQARLDTVQMVFQDPQSALNPRRRVASIVTQAMEAGARATTWDERLARARELLREIGLPPETATRYPSQLSGGQRQRVNIARALCTTPKVLVADEIVSGLDVSVQAQLLNLLLRLRDEFGFSMLFISHDLSVVRYLCSRVLVMWRGEVVETGPTETVFANPQHPYTRMLLAAVPPDDPAAAWNPLDEVERLTA